MIIKDLGAVTAYAAAVEKGYTGTEEEFATLMASYATVAEAAAESAESASQSAESASASASTATQKASEATTAAQTATAKAEETQADADAAALDASQALSAASTATSKASEAAQSASDAVTAKTAAQTAQTAAEGSATTAQTAAQTATQKAAEAAESARTLTIDTTLSQSGQAADAGAVGDALAGKVDADGEHQITPQNISGMQFTKTAVDVEGENIFDSSMLFEEGHYVNIDTTATPNVITHATSPTYNAYVIPVEPNSKYTFTQARFACLAKGNTLASESVGSLLSYATSIETDTASYLFLSITTDVTNIQVKKVTQEATYTDFILPDWLKTDTSELESGLESVESEKVDKNGTEQIKPQNIDGVTVSGGNILDDAERLYSTQPNVSTTDGYVTIQNGVGIIQTTANYCSFLIPVKQNTHYTANHSIRFAVLLKNLSTEGTRPVKYSTVIGSALAYITSFDTGEADHIIVSWDYNSFPIDGFIISEGDTPTTVETIALPDWLDPNAKALRHSVSEITFPKYISTTGNLSNGTYLALLGYKQNLRKGERYVFSSNITTMETLKFGFTYANSFSVSTTLFNEFAIDSTNITYKTKSTNQTATAQFAHGLTFANNIQFIFEYLPTGQAKITLITNGNMFTQTLAFVKQTISQVAVVSDGSTLTDCKLTWTPIDIDKLIWMFGNSYFAYDAARWPYYLHEYGYDKNILIDGWPGEGSVNARNSLLTLIQFGVPKYIVWCMGMNDGSDTDADTPSSDWALRRDEMLEICEQYNITPIFATIPNVPKVLNTGKNAWVRASGYRYIDFAKAVGASSSGVWFNGMLSSDNVHPTEQGARALFARVLLDFPEIMLDGTN